MKPKIPRPGEIKPAPPNPHAIALGKLSRKNPTTKQSRASRRNGLKGGRPAKPKQNY